MPEETGEEAIRQLHHARAVEPGRITHEELKLRLDLDDDQLLRLLQITDREAGPFAADNALDAANVYGRAAQAMIAANDASIGAVRIEMANMRRVVAERALGSDLEDALNRRWKLGFGAAASTTDIAGFNSLQQLDRMRRRANAFVDALEKMREVYFAQPCEWHLTRYLDHQEQIERDIMTWVAGELLRIRLWLHHHHPDLASRRRPTPGPRT